MKIFKRIAIITLIIVPFYYLALILKVLNVADLSKAEVYHRPESERGYNVHLVTYADGPDVYHKNRNIEVYSGINRGVDFIYLYRKENIDPEFRQANPVLEEKMGAGYWLWKPYLILKTLESIPEGDILLYMDSGLLISRPIGEFIKATLKNKDIVLFDYDMTEHGTASTVANGDTFAAVGCQTEACYKSPHVIGGMLLLRNTLKTRTFIRQWLTLCTNRDLLTGQTSKIPNQPNFAHQQHDEGILCALAAKNAEDIYFFKMKTEFYYHFYMHRRKVEGESLLPRVLVNLAKASRTAINNWFIKVYGRLTDFFLPLKKNNFRYD